VSQPKGAVQLTVSVKGENEDAHFRDGPSLTDRKSRKQLRDLVQSYINRLLGIPVVRCVSSLALENVRCFSTKVNCDAVRLENASTGTRYYVLHSFPTRDKVNGSIVWPQRFGLPRRKGLRPAWLLRLGLFIHDHLGMPLRDVSRIGFEFSDCRGQGNRLVVLNAREAQMSGILHFGYCLRSWPAIRTHRPGILTDTAGLSYPDPVRTRTVPTASATEGGTP
jgi:hypothetical protein